MYIVSCGISRANGNPGLFAWAINGVVHVRETRINQYVQDTMQNLWQSTLTHWGWIRMAAISQTTLSNSFYWMKMFLLWFKFHWSLFLAAQLTTNQYWFRKGLGIEQVTNHYLKQLWPRLLTHKCIYIYIYNVYIYMHVTRPQWIDVKSHDI